LDDEDVTGAFVVDDGVEERFVGSDEDPSSFFEVESIGQAKNRRVSKEEIIFDCSEILKFTFEC